VRKNDPYLQFQQNHLHDPLVLFANPLVPSKTKPTLAEHKKNHIPTHTTPPDTIKTPSHKTCQITTFYHKESRSRTAIHCLHLTHFEKSVKTQTNPNTEHTHKHTHTHTHTNTHSLTHMPTRSTPLRSTTTTLCFRISSKQQHAHTHTHTHTHPLVFSHRHPLLSQVLSACIPALKTHHSVPIPIQQQQNYNCKISSISSPQFLVVGARDQQAPKSSVILVAQPSSTSFSLSTSSTSTLPHSTHPTSTSNHCPIIQLLAPCSHNSVLHLAKCHEPCLPI
jgi:hypothetical protein